MLMLSYFLKMVLKKAQSFIHIDSIHGIVSQDGYYLKSKKERRRLRHVSGQSKTAGLQDMSRF